MTEETQKLSVGEMKFRSMVSDLMVMEVPRMEVEVPPPLSKARNLRRMFYFWGNKLPAYERKFMNTLTFKLRGRVIVIERRLDFQPKEIANATSNQGESAGNHRLDNSR